ncbi:MAG: hypothetical protein R2839_11330 [Thermomicrobiales bacterium]
MLARVCTEALNERYPGDQTRARQRLAEEMHVIGHHKLAGFFLLYRDLLILAREVADEIRGTSSLALQESATGTGRGSSVSSIVCYLIGLSHVDPLQHDLFSVAF